MIGARCECESEDGVEGNREAAVLNKKENKSTGEEEDEDTDAILKMDFEELRKMLRGQYGML